MCEPLFSPTCEKPRNNSETLKQFVSEFYFSFISSYASRFSRELKRKQNQSWIEHDIVCVQCTKLAKQQLIAAYRRTKHHCTNLLEAIV